MSITFRRSSTYGWTKSSCGVVDACMAASNGTRGRRRCRAADSSLARSSIHFVTSVSAGPPLGGLYLNPPSPGGLCDGVTTIPSARWSVPPRLWTRMAREMTGVGVTPSSRWIDRPAPRSPRAPPGPSAGPGRQAVRVLAHVERAVDPLAPPVVADGLGDRQDVGLGERPLGGRPAVPARAEADELLGVVHVGPAIVVLALEPGRVDQEIAGRRLAGEGEIDMVYVRFGDQQPAKLNALHSRQPPWYWRSFAPFSHHSA